jgi:hypothetical protein
LVTANSHELTSPSRGLLSALRRSIPRDEFFAGLYILGCANGFLIRIIQDWDSDGWTGVVLGANAIALFACLAGVSSMLCDKQDKIRSADLAVAVLFLLLVIHPIFALSWVAVTGLSLYILLVANGGADRKRGAVILLALTVPMLWSPLIFKFFARPILQIDASLAAWVLGTDWVGNTVRFADNSGYMVVLPVCSSFANTSLAFLCWVSVTQWAKHRWCSMDILWSLLACTSVIAVNVTRIALAGLSQSSYEVTHSQLGGMVTNSLILFFTVGFSVFGARRELFSRA